VILVVTLPFTIAAFQIKPWRKPARSLPLVTRGVFAHVRHPLMFRDAFWPLGWSLIFASTIGACLTPVWFGLCVLTTLAEEEKLLDAYGEEYARYRERTPRLAPFMRWRR
jgi:protein-S-isoprenylcysteine O-methyltransferase Ste14